MAVAAEISMYRVTIAMTVSASHTSKQSGMSAVHLQDGPLQTTLRDLALCEIQLHPAYCPRADSQP